MAKRLVFFVVYYAVYCAVYVAVATMLVLNLFDRGEAEAIVVGVAGVVVCGSMISLSRSGPITSFP